MGCVSKRYYLTIYKLFKHRVKSIERAETVKDSQNSHDSQIRMTRRLAL